MSKPSESHDLGADALASTGEALPLSGMVVVEFCQIAAGPYCGMLLADMGADVIKVEPPTGDAMRQWPPLNGGFSENFASINRNKRSVALDLKNPEDLATALKLAKRADVLLENNRPGVMDRLGLGYEALSKENPGLVYCSISAFGQQGPRSREGAFDVTMQGISGIMSVTGEPDGEPVKCGVPVSDFATGLYGAFNISSALLKRSLTGRGTHIDAPMLGASLGIAALQTSEFFGTGKHPRKLGSKHPRNAPYQAYRASDEFFVIAAGNDRLWASVCDVIGTPELLDDERFRTTSDRAANQDAMKPLLEAKFGHATAQQWLTRFREAGVPSAPIYQYGEILDDPQVQSYGWVQDMQLPNGADIRTFGAPISMSGLDFPIRRAAPELNADRDDVMNWLAQEK
ncbi:MAG: crotonobetainyl-CoA:carnitine CoA-transferase CaiB-like acyl-CoA transferase [Gammaproteobacteria bacterium]|jgi:crotonobetainyl-CoA:carnitine CoA-transferase CaiB-like acyl-CoA transferase